MKNAAEFVNIANMAFQNIVSLAEKDDIPIAFKDDFTVFDVTDAEGGHLVICFDELSGLRPLLNLFSILRRNHNDVLVFLPREAINRYKDLIQTIYRIRIGYVNEQGYVCRGGEVAVSFIESVISDAEGEEECVYTKSTQLVFKFYLFNEKSASTVRHIASRLGISPASVSRANDALCRLGVLTRRGYGAGLEYELSDKKSALRILRPHFLSPIEKTHHLVLTDEEYGSVSNNPISGELALSEYTDLLPMNANDTFAMGKKEFAAFIASHTGVMRMGASHYVTIHCFSYDPRLFAKGRYIDLFDLYVMTLKRADRGDPRVDEAISGMERRLVTRG